MNAFLGWEQGELWQLAGWTMIHFLWVGVLVAVLAAIGGLVLRRASANIRYAVALAALLAFAATPIGIGAWLAAQPQVVAKPRADVVGPALVDAGAAVDINSEIALQPTLDDSLRAGEPVPMAIASPSAARAPLNLFALESWVRYLPWLWIVGTPLTLALLASGVIGAERLKRSSRTLDDDPITELCTQLAKVMHVGRRVTVAVCDRIAAPVLVGIVRPIILLPPAALSGWSVDEIEMVLLHELAHVRRWDNLVNLVQRIIESLLFFHPAVWLLSRWVRREREACCDAVVVARTNRPQAYAEMLVALAAQMPRHVLFHPAASSAMAAGPLRSRIRSILKLEDDPMFGSGKSLLTAFGLLLLTAALVVLYLPSRGNAEDLNAEAAESARNAAEAAEEVADREDETKPTRHPKFPSLEEQKLADAVYKWLGCELEAIGEEDLKRVRALGYDGGLRIVAVGYVGGNRGLSMRGGGRGDFPIQFGDILVGLHVWPTTSLTDIVAVRDRDDLAQLNPLKVYFVRNLGKVGEDNVVTGRITVDVPARPTPQRAMPPESVREYRLDMSDEGLDMLQEQLNILQQQVKGLDAQHSIGEVPEAPIRSTDKSLLTRTVIVPATSGLRPFAGNPHTTGSQPRKAQSTPTDDKSSLRYQDQDFNYWRQHWLSRNPLHQSEALPALKAFGAAGYEKEVAGSMIFGVYSEHSVIASPSREYLSTISADAAAPHVVTLITTLKSELSTNRRTATILALAAMGPHSEPAMDLLKKSLASNDPRERIAAAVAIKRILGKDQYQKPVADVLGKELGIEAVQSNDGNWGVVPRDDATDDGTAFMDFNDAVIEEQQKLFPP